MRADSQSDRKVLVVEDEYIIARDMSEALERSGVSVLGPVATLQAAMGVLDCHADIAGAVLDVRLRGGNVYPVAEALRQRGVPFVFATGCERASIEPAFQDVIYCEKPQATAKVVHAIQTEMARLLMSRSR